MQNARKLLLTLSLITIIALTGCQPRTGEPTDTPATAAPPAETIPQAEPAPAPTATTEAPEAEPEAAKEEPAAAPPTTDIPSTVGTVPTEHVMVEMSDGTKLATDYYLPEWPGPYPVILARSCYGRGINGTKDSFNERGYAVVVQDIRGTGESEGDTSIFYADGWRADYHDGLDTIEWIKQQEWCDGKIATYGGSALAMTQMLLAPASQDIAAQFMDMVPASLYGQVIYQGGVWRKSLAEGWLEHGVHQPEVAEEWKAHPTYDEYWKYYNIGEKIADVTAPALLVGGWYDIFQQGTIEQFVLRQNEAGEGARGNQHLIMKWSTHGDDRPDLPIELNQNRFDDMHVSQHRKAFLDYYMMGIDMGYSKEPAVYYYVMGDDAPGAPGMEWRTADTWPPFPIEETAYYLNAENALSTTAPETGAASANASFAYDPANPFPTHGGANLLLPAGPFDQREVNKDRTDYLAFASSPLTEPLEIGGPVTVPLYVSTDAPDTDFTAKLVDIFPDGREILMLDSIQRVKFRDGFEEAAPLLTSADEVVKVTVDLGHISWIFNTGHKIGLQISSSNYPRFEKNPNTGDDFPSEDNLRVANNTVHFSASQPSAVVLPVRNHGVTHDAAPADNATEKAEENAE